MIRKVFIILVFVFGCKNSFSQKNQKSLFSKKKQEEKVSIEKRKKLFENSFFMALRAKSIGDNQEALKHFEDCISLD